MMGLLWWEMILGVYIYMYTRIMGLGFLDTMFTASCRLGSSCLLWGLEMFYGDFPQSMGCSGPGRHDMVKGIGPQLQYTSGLA